MQGTFVLSTYRQKNEVEKRQVGFRRTKLRYVALLIACLVVFGCEYCFDTASVNIKLFRLCKVPLNKTIHSPVLIRWGRRNSIYCIHCMLFPT